MGLDVAEDHFYTSALATAAFLKEQAPGCSVYVIGEAGLYNALYEAGITMNDVNPDYVVVGEGIAYSLDTLTKATNLVLAGAKLIGANSDVSGPIENGISLHVERRRRYVGNRKAYRFVKLIKRNLQIVMAKQSYLWKKCLNGWVRHMDLDLYPCATLMPVVLM